MQPNNQQPQNVVQPSNSPGGNDYDFIQNTPSTPNKPSLFSGNNTLQRVLVVAALLVIVLVILGIGKSLLGGKSNSPQMIAVAQSQQQVIALSTNALEVPGLSIENRNFAITAKLSVASDQRTILKYLSSKKVKTNAALLSKTNDAKASKKLTDSIANNTYNENFKIIMKEKMQLYQDSLVTAYRSVSAPKSKATLNSMSESNDLLIKMLGN